MHYLSRLARHIEDLHERGFETVRFDNPFEGTTTIVIRKNGVEFKEDIRNSSLSDDVLVYHTIRKLVERLEACLSRTCGECSRYVYDSEYDIYWCNKHEKRIELHDVSCKDWKDSNRFK